MSRPSSSSGADSPSLTATLGHLNGRQDSEGSRSAVGHPDSASDSAQDDASSIQEPAGICPCHVAMTRDTSASLVSSSTAKGIPAWASRLRRNQERLLKQMEKLEEDNVQGFWSTQKLLRTSGSGTGTHPAVESHGILQDKFSKRFSRLEASFETLNNSVSKISASQEILQEDASSNATQILRMSDHLLEQKASISNLHESLRSNSASAVQKILGRVSNDKIDLSNLLLEKFQSIEETLAALVPGRALTESDDPSHASQAAHGHYTAEHGSDKDGGSGGSGRDSGQGEPLTRPAQPVDMPSSSKQDPMESDNERPQKRKALWNDEDPDDVVGNSDNVTIRRTRRKNAMILRM